MNRFRTLCLALVAAFALTGAAPAQAYLIFFAEDANNSEDDPLINNTNNRMTAFPNAYAAEAAFLSNLIGVGTETFEGIPDGTKAPLNLVFPGAGTATLTGSSGEVRSNLKGLTNRGFGRYGVTDDGDREHFWEVRAGTITGDFIITFSQDIAAFGFWGIDLGDFGGNLELLLSLSQGGTILETIDHSVGSLGSTGGSVVFWGIIAEAGDSPFDEIDFVTNVLSPDDFQETFAFDDFTIGSLEQVVIPEPTAALLIGVGLIGLGVSRKRND